MTTPTPLSVSLAEEIASELYSRGLLNTERSAKPAEAFSDCAQIIQRRVEPLERAFLAADAFRIAVELLQNACGMDLSIRADAAIQARKALFEALARLKGGR